ncbi:hypothetical protein ACP70R_034834 [Stipagrostis hirtigluma subsp. patula]
MASSRKNAATTPTPAAVALLLLLAAALLFTVAAASDQQSSLPHIRKQVQQVIRRAAQPRRLAVGASTLARAIIPSGPSYGEAADSPPPPGEVKA